MIVLIFRRKERNKTIFKNEEFFSTNFGRILLYLDPDPHFFEGLDPDPHFFMRIRDTAGKG